MDAYAARIGADPLAVRKRNLIKRTSMPYVRDFDSSPSMTFEEGDYEAMLKRVLAEVDLDDLHRRRSNGELVGLGVTPYIESTRLGPWEAASVEVDEGGRIVVRSGGSSVGQGFRTMLSSVVGSVFGIDYGSIHVQMLDTKSFGDGVGSYASRSTSTAGSAAHLAAIEIEQRMRKVAADNLDVAADDLGFDEGGVFSPAGDRLSFGDVRALAERQGIELFSHQTFTSDTVNLDFGTVAVVVRVDPATAGVHVERLVVGFETGTVLNRKIVEGQLVGAALQGVGGALLEQFRFDEEGNPLVTSFMDYLMPTLSEAPAMTPITFEEPSDANPLGTKGVGEGGITGVGGAIASAVENAISASDLIDRLPVDIEAVLGALEGGRSL
jgi:CO/xanthine dehydrogenase Mo-binding subunit